MTDILSQPRVMWLTGLPLPYTQVTPLCVLVRRCRWCKCVLLLFVITVILLKVKIISASVKPMNAASEFALLGLRSPQKATHCQPIRTPHRVVSTQTPVKGSKQQNTGGSVIFPGCINIFREKPKSLPQRSVAYHGEGRL